MDRNLWERIRKRAQEVGGNCAEIVLEADVWAQKTLEEYDAFTIA